MPRFSIYTSKNNYHGLLICRDLIIIKDDDGHIVRWTNFHMFCVAPSKAKTVKHITSYDHKRTVTIVAFLNYVFFERKLVTRLTDITVEHARMYLTAYGMCELADDTKDTHRNEKTVTTTLNYILDFYKILSQNCSVSYKEDDLYKTTTRFSKRVHRMVKHREPTFEVFYKTETVPIFRDMPESVFRIIFNEIFCNHKDLLMLVAGSAFGGCRPGESCNFRREESPYGPGLSITYLNGKPYDITIDLQHEYVLRSDMVRVGEIKKERIVRIHPMFINAFHQSYMEYLRFDEGRAYEKEYSPLSLNRQGKAMTYKAYYNQFNRVIAGLIPVMLRSDDPEVATYGFMLQERNIAPHIFRHFFSAMLTINGATVAELMYYRGDTSPESALTYLQNKSDLERQFRKVNNAVFDFTLWRSGND